MKGRKGKKKTFTTPKKIQHEKKETLAVLKLYKVDEVSGTVAKLRKECPGSMCGEGTFMASHSDRLSCGKCGLTYFYDAAVEVSAAAAS